jgi:hypothetical protein
MNLELINVIFQNLEREQGAVVSIVYLGQVHECMRKLLKKKYCIWRQYKELECTFEFCLEAVQGAALCLEMVQGAQLFLTMEQGAKLYLEAGQET